MNSIQTTRGNTLPIAMPYVRSSILATHADSNVSTGPIIETANHASPAFARIFKDHVIITHRDRPLPVNPKGTVLRKLALQAYTSEIDALYRVSEDIDDKDEDEDELDFPTTWAKGDVIIWVKKMVNDVMGNEVAIDRDLFEQGADRYAYFINPL